MSRGKNFLIGPPLPTQQFSHERLIKNRVLATFSPDSLSSIAYANQEIFLGLVVDAARLYRRRHLGYQCAIIDIPYHLDH